MAREQSEGVNVLDTIDLSYLTFTSTSIQSLERAQHQDYKYEVPGPTLNISLSFTFPTFTTQYSITQLIMFAPARTALKPAGNFLRVSHLYQSFILT